MTSGTCPGVVCVYDPCLATRVQTIPLVGGRERERLVRRAKLLAWGGIGWHFIEFAIAVAAGVAASSIALVGFGFDSLIESLAGFAVLWRFGAGRAESEGAERRAQQVIAVSFYVLAAYVGTEAVRALIVGNEPEVSWVGIGLAAMTAPTMPLLARAKRRVGDKLGSSATVTCPSPCSPGWGPMPCSAGGGQIPSLPW
jgi:divalent metal cation (Fe/Co/Zn/Cd) transporter